MPEESDEHSIEANLPPDIVEATLPYLSSNDIRNLSLTNKYFHKLLDYENSSTLWHELYHKAFGTTNTNDEPFLTKTSQDFKTCSETILLNRYPEKTWLELYNLRSSVAGLYTWGCLKHARLGYTLSSHSLISDSFVNSAGLRLKFGINSPVEVPWFVDSHPISARANSWTNEEDSQIEANIQEDDKTIVQISGGGFSFQILTKSGKLFSTGSTYNGGHKGPGPRNGEHDYNPFKDMISSIEQSYPVLRRAPIRAGGTINTTGVMGDRHNRMADIPIELPHRDIYSSLRDMEEKVEHYLPGNKHIRRMFCRDCFDIYSLDNNSFEVAEARLNAVKFVAISSGRSHFLALDDKNELYSWDGPEVEHGIKLQFEGLPPRETNPILKIGCGWNFNCAFFYEVGLVVWRDRSPLQKGESYSRANYQVVPNTGDVNGEHKVIDFACCQDNSVFYINNEGHRLWLYSNGTTRYIDLPVNGKLSKIVGSNNTLALFTEQNCYIVTICNGEVVYDSLTKLELDDSTDRFISLSTGDYHTVALTANGQIYTWGLESEMCGCLGLGTPSHIVEERQAGQFENARSIKVGKPTRVSIGCDYTCVAITAGGWQTGALIIKL